MGKVDIKKAGAYFVLGVEAFLIVSLGAKLLTQMDTDSKAPAPVAKTSSNEPATVALPVDKTTGTSASTQQKLIDAKTVSNKCYSVDLPSDFKATEDNSEACYLLYEKDMGTYTYEAEFDTVNPNDVGDEHADLVKTETVMLAGKSVKRYTYDYRKTPETSSDNWIVAYDLVPLKTTLPGEGSHLSVVFYINSADLTKASTLTDAQIASATKVLDQIAASLKLN